ncbi:hypothetical protein HYE67_010283 [Fusarium culmorum]|uniref:Uncharacterized protein n=1 Tax=Fusarium culmorum TaxID=5516 RepID=A0A2T4H4S1_FUSCU|nr:hypothetical protein FCULG_00011312 [Fusarium culmorum]QPC68052.1 hypothetical protein HYE67_010283 [Fusarium culmorum]
MDVDNIEEYNGTHDFGKNTFWDFDSFRFDTRMPFRAEPDSAEPFDADISMDFVVCPPSDKHIHDVDMIDADAEEDGSSYEILVHKRVNHSFAIPNAKCFDIDPSSLIWYLHHVGPKSNSAITEEDLNDFAGLQLDVCRFPGHRRQDMSSACGASEERRIYHKAVSVKRGSRYQSHIPSMKIMQKKLGSEFLYNAILKMNEDEELGLDGVSRIKLKQEMDIDDSHRRHQG